MATILCIDDEPAVLKLYGALLESKGYKVLTASDGPTGIALARHHEIDAVILDSSVPGTDGIQVDQVLREEQPALPVVIWSGCPDGTSKSPTGSADALLCGGDTLLSTVEKVLKDSGTKSVPSEAMIDMRPIPAAKLS